MAIENTTTSVISIIRGMIDDLLRTDGRDSEQYDTSSVFFITEDFVSSATITVYVNGVETSNFTYDSDNNAVTIADSIDTDAIVLMKYSYYKKYSDTELEGYLNSSLAYFPLYQYKKTFEINTDDEIIAINDYIPTTNELYFIAIIASILIDPQNIKISIPDLALSAKRDKPDQDQIKESFRNFQNFLGFIDYEEI